MTISIRSSFAFTTEAPIDAMLQFEAADIPEQKLLSCNTDMTEAAQCIRCAAPRQQCDKHVVQGRGQVSSVLAASATRDAANYLLVGLTSGEALRDTLGFHCRGSTGAGRYGYSLRAWL